LHSGETVEHSYTVQALKKGFTRMDRSVINYKYTDDAGEEQVGIFCGRCSGGVWGRGARACTCACMCTRLPVRRQVSGSQFTLPDAPNVRIGCSLPPST
jgi:hypothetical protein